MSDEIDPQLEPEVMAKVSAWKGQLKLRCWGARLELPEGRLIHLVHEGHIYVLANAIVGHETLDTGETVPRYNFESYWQPQIKVPLDDAPAYYQDMYKGMPFEFRPREVVIQNPQPYGLRPILCPWLAVKLDLEGNLVADGAGPQSFEVGDGIRLY